MYHTSKSPDELYKALLAQEGVVDQRQAASLTVENLVRSEYASYMSQRSDQGFSLHCVSAGHTSSTTGLLPTLRLEGKYLQDQGKGTRVELRFRYARSGAALQRVAGLSLTTLLGLLWVMLGSGALFDRAIVFGVFVLFVAPVVIRDLRATKRRKRERLALLNLAQGAYGGLALPDPSSQRSPYREGESSME